MAPPSSTGLESITFVFSLEQNGHFMLILLLKIAHMERVLIINFMIRLP